jgi:hypothetical protein
LNNQLIWKDTTNRLNKHALQWQNFTTNFNQKQNSDPKKRFHSHNIIFH